MSQTQRFRKISIFFSIIVSLIGLLVLIGWMGDITFLKSITPDRLSLKANAAICFLLAGIVVFLVNKEKKSIAANWIIGSFSVIIFFIGTITCLEYIFNINSGLDELLFKDDSIIVENLPPGRQSIFSAFYFMFFGFCYLPVVSGKINKFICQFLHVLSGLIALGSFMSYVLGLYVVAGIEFDFIYTIHSTFSFLLLILAVLFSEPDKGYMKMVSSDSTGGKILRSRFPIGLLVFILMGWLIFQGAKQGFYNYEFSIIIFIFSLIIVFSFMLISDTVSLTRSEIILQQSAEQLKKLNKNLEAAEKMAKLGSWEYDMTGEHGVWSKQIFSLLDLPASEKAPPFKEFLRLIHPEERRQAQEIFDQMVDGIEIENKIFRTNPERGEVKYLLLDWHVIKDKNKKPLKYFGTLQCVTERIKEREKLKRSEELFKKAFQSKVFGLAIVNKERRVVDVNETITSLLGYRREDFIGKTSLEIGLSDPEYIKKRDELIMVLFTKGKIDEYELDVITKNGKPLSLLLSVEPLSLSGEPHWLIYLKDVTEKKKAEKQLKESEKRLHTILQTEPECVKLIDLNGDLTYINPAGLAMLEADSFEMVSGKKSFNCISEPYRDAFFQMALNVFKGHSGKLEYEITGMKGTVRMLETHVVPLKDSNEKIISMLGITRDVTENRKTAARLNKYNIELRQLTAHLQKIREEERKSIAREIHDDLGQHLTILKLDIARLLKQSNNNKEWKENISSIIGQADHCISRVRKISTNLRPSIIDDFGIIAALEWQAEEFEKNTKIKTRFTSNIESINLPAEHTNSLFRIFQESLTNVSRHSEAKNVISTLQLQDKVIVLKIKDDGKGFDTSLLKTKKTLGLMGMKERVLLLNGTYDIVSDEGKGTEIIVKIPLPD